jgi:hypothetical protein
MAGRPTVVTPEVVLKLEEAFALGCSDREACFFAGISNDALYGYCKKHPEFTDRKEQLKERPIFLARKSLIDGVQKDPKLALAYLERKKKGEFSLRQELEAKIDATLEMEAKIRAEVESDLLGKKMGESGTSSHAERILKERT